MSSLRPSKYSCTTVSTALSNAVLPAHGHSNNPRRQEQIKNNVHELPVDTISSRAPSSPMSRVAGFTSKCTSPIEGTCLNACPTPCRTCHTAVSHREGSCQEQQRHQQHQQQRRKGRKTLQVKNDRQKTQEQKHHRRFRHVCWNSARRGESVRRPSPFRPVSENAPPRTSRRLSSPAPSANLDDVELTPSSSSPLSLSRLPILVYCTLRRLLLPQGPSSNLCK